MQFTSIGVGRRPSLSSLPSKHHVELRHQLQVLGARVKARTQACVPTSLAQVLGLTNYSHWPRDEAAPLRACLRSNAIAREMLLKLATKRLRGMAHVGLTERLEESVVSMAADLGAWLVGMVPLRMLAYEAWLSTAQGMGLPLCVAQHLALRANHPKFARLPVQASTWMGPPTATRLPAPSATMPGRKTTRVRCVGCPCHRRGSSGGGGSCGVYHGCSQQP